MATTKSSVTKTTKTTAPAPKAVPELKAPTAPAEAKKEEIKKAEPAKKAPAKTAGKASAAKKAAPKAEKKEVTVKSSVTLQINGTDYDPAKIQEDAVAAAKSKKADVKDVKVYIKADESVAYYTIDGEGSADYKIEL
ncbi:hypothetical protein BXO88_15450 [Oribacterium sp. C9]|uniref:DUF6465 family protein n=1 Tax=Oribacterium sp. C9 TaxID=1943579 RepID=UPI00098F4B61|nr:DUF6465 family protein [Oribacterium sp. C9]OON84813.1 hypothetical protein BXO88_15450 [Oribacterium sp. C9]